MHPTPSPADLWAEVERLTAQAIRSTFAVGDVWLSPGCHRFEVVHVTPEGMATLEQQGPGWARSVTIAWNSPKLDRWQLIERPGALAPEP